MCVFCFGSFGQCALCKWKNYNNPPTNVIILAKCRPFQSTMWRHAQRNCLKVVSSSNVLFCVTENMNPRKYPCRSKTETATEWPTLWKIITACRRIFTIVPFSKRFLLVWYLTFCSLMFRISANNLCRFFDFRLFSRGVLALNLPTGSWFCYLDYSNYFPEFMSELFEILIQLESYLI